MPRSAALLLLRAAHPREAIATATVLAGAAALAGRPAREVALVAVTVLVGQVVVGWSDHVGRRDAEESAGGAAGESAIDAGSVWFALACAVLLVVPLAVAHGPRAGLAYLAAVAIRVLGDLVLRRRALSFLPWMASFACYPAFLSYGGWGGIGTGTPPRPELIALAAALGLGVHVLVSLPRLDRAREGGARSLPVLLAGRVGRARLTLTAYIFTGLIGLDILIAGWPA